MSRLSLFLLPALFAVAILFSSCSATNRTIREPNSHVQFVKNDFIFSEQVEAERSLTHIFGINLDFFNSTKTGEIEKSGGGSLVWLARLPIIGSIVEDKASYYAMYNLLKNNPGYDVIFYPQVETKFSRPFFGLGFIYKKRTVKVRARLGKIKTE